MRLLARCPTASRHNEGFRSSFLSQQSHRALSTSPRSYAETFAQKSKDPPSPHPIDAHDIDRTTVLDRRSVRALAKAGLRPIGSRRRRAAIRDVPGIPFEQLPYQCFQEARKVLLDDRQEKVAQIELQRARIDRLKSTELPDGDHKAAQSKDTRLKNMQKNLEKLKVLADINDPMAKKRFEDGNGDMSRPIYRHLAEKRFRKQRQLILQQRVEQMDLIPDLLPRMQVTSDMTLSFGRRMVHPGAIVPSRMSTIPPRITIQPYDAGARLVTIVLVDPDVPNVTTDSFDSRCHFCAVNVRISPTDTIVHLGRISALGEAAKDSGRTIQADSPGNGQLILPWLPPFAQKGSPYHRLALFVLDQPREAPPLNTDEVNSWISGKASKRKAKQQKEGQNQETASHLQNLESRGASPHPDQPYRYTSNVFPPSKSSVSEDSPVANLERNASDAERPATASKPEPSDQHSMASRMHFTLRSLVTRFQLQPTSAFLFRTEWDEDMDTVMRKLQVGDGLTSNERVDVELKNRRFLAMPRRMTKREKAARYR
ncbi:MAG: hypothetical protein M1831_004386 [Alyxoria varia]|nr:MAG: hypothetical protein M1831_004386 [Alyxoria varia]